MAINKVVYGDQTLIDLTGDTVEASNLLEGETAHTRSGSPVTGTAKQGHIIKDVDGTVMTQRPAIKFADADVSDDSTNQQTVVEVMHDPITRQSFEDAQNLDDGLYPIEGDNDNTVLSSDMISHGNGTVEQAIDGKVSDNPTFTEAQTRTNIASGESFATILGKIKKWFSDLASMFVSKSGDTMSGQLNIDQRNGTISDIGFSVLALGNSIASGNANNSTGIIDLYSDSGKKVRLYTVDNVSGTKFIKFPDKDGIVALTSDIPTDFVSKSNGGTFDNDITVDSQNGTAGSNAYTFVKIGNQIGKSSAKHSTGVLRLCGENAKYTDVYAPNATATRDIIFPDKSGTIALTSDIPDISTKVSKSGDTMTGNLAISKAGETYCKAINTTTGVGIYLDSDADGKHGIWSGGYYDSSYHASGRWILHRSTNAGKVYVNQTEVPHDGGVVALAKPSVDGNMNSAASFGNASGMINLTGSNTNVNPNGQTGWHHFINISYFTEANNMWQTQFAIKAGTTDVWVRSRAGGSIVDGTAWAANWVRLVKTSDLNDYELKSASSIHHGYVVTDVQVETPSILLKDARSGKLVNLYTATLTSNRNIKLPDKAGTIALTSDISSERFKENIIPLSDDEAKKLLDVEVVNFDYKEGITGEDERYNNKGVIAEQVENIIPYVIEHEKDEETDEDILRVDYRKFIPYLIKMVQMQQKEIERLNEIINGKSM